MTTCLSETGRYFCAGQKKQPGSKNVKKYRYICLQQGLRAL